jgi:hypothetical protein
MLGSHPWTAAELRNEQLVTLEPGPNGIYAVSPTGTDDQRGSPEDQADATGGHLQGDSDNRQAVYLEARSLFPSVPQQVGAP